MIYIHVLILAGRYGFCFNPVEYDVLFTCQSVYMKETCGLVFFKADLATTLSENKCKLCFTCA